MLRKSLMLIAITAACGTGSSKSNIPDAPPSITGRVTLVTPSADGGSVRVEANPEGVAGTSAMAVVRVTPTTTVIAPKSEGIGFSALRAGQTVRVWFVGPVRQSQPVQANAGTIVIDSTSGGTPAAADSLVLERSVCYGTCPAYRLRLSGTGEVRFESRNSGDESRTAVDTVTATTLPTLVSRARSIGFFDLPPKIQGDSVLCPSAHTDAPTVIVTIFSKDGTRPVEDDHGCAGRIDHKIPPPLEQLRAFESEIDSVLKSSRWVRPATRR
jgi:hypothetical protein